MKTFALVIAAVALHSACAAADFAAFKAKYAKHYPSSDEERVRAAVFGANVQIIEEHNAKYKAGEVTWYMGVNEHTDLAPTEFAARFLGGVKRPAATSDVAPRPLTGETLPASWDWVARNVTPPIKNQGNCGSCWAFSATSTVESITAIKTGKPVVSLSEQQYVDCVSSCYGCGGGFPSSAFEYLIHVSKKGGGQCSEASYPYKGTNGRCRASKCNPVATITGWQPIQKDSEQALMEAVVAQPVSVLADASAWANYAGGVMSGSCGEQLDHAIVAEGYGVSKGGQKYWLIRNSWGPTWGLSGYLHLARGESRNGECGVLMEATIPLKAN